MDGFFKLAVMMLLVALVLTIHREVVPQLQAIVDVLTFIANRP